MELLWKPSQDHPTRCLCLLWQKLLIPFMKWCQMKIAWGRHHSLIEVTIYLSFWKKLTLHPSFDKPNSQARSWKKLTRSWYLGIIPVHYQVKYKSVRYDTYLIPRQFLSHFSHFLSRNMIFVPVLTQYRMVQYAPDWVVQGGMAVHDS